MKKVRLAFFSDILTEDFDGCLRTVHQLIKRIPKDKFEVLFVTGVKPNNPIPHDILQVPAVTFPIDRRYKMAYTFGSRKKIIAQLDAFKPDIIHVTTPSPFGNFGAKYAKDRGIYLSTIYHTHFISYVKYYFQAMPKLGAFFEQRFADSSKKFYSKCDVIFTPVQFIIDEFKKYGIPHQNCKIWARGIDTTLFNPSKRKNGLLQKLTGNNKPNVLFASRLVWEKNLITLIDVYKNIQERKLDVNLVIVGEGKAKITLQNKMPKAFFTGDLTHHTLAEHYASADIFLFPSDTETYGNVVVEAMASKLPVIAADKGGPTGIIDHGTNGFLVNSHNPSAYVDIIEQLISDKEMMESIAQNALIYTNKLNWDEITAQYFNHLLEMEHSSKLVYA